MKFGNHISTIYSGSIQSTQARFFSQKRRAAGASPHAGGTFDKNSLQSALLSDMHGVMKDKDVRQFKTNKLLF